MSDAKWMLLAVTAGLAACSSPEAANNATAPGSLPDNVLAANAMGNEAMGNEAMGSAAGAMAASTGASATLSTAQGKAAGTVRIVPADGGLKVSVAAQGLTPGDHGVHVHMTGKCDAPKFESAGGHWNPTGAKHGLDNPQGQHAGDMPNLVIGADGTGKLDYVLKGGTLAALLDADGAAFVVHAKVDDQKTDPSGASGDRIACGVLTAG